jgi:catechol 2,3-dioxygenase-like lactoylglutathione lyase family enzyme
MVATPPAVNRILETSLYVEALERSIGFYARVFGFEIMFRDDRMCAMAVPGRQALLLFRKGGSTKRSETPFGFIPPHDAQGTQHLCFSITHSALNAWQDHLKDLGIVLESHLDWSHGGSSLYFRDPDGHSVEVGTSGLWQNDPARVD